MPTDKPLTILLVEDDDVAAEAFIRALSKAACPYPIVWAEDGDMALAALRGQDPLRQMPRPRLVLLDLNMPRVDGFSFLQQARADAALHDEVIFVLSTSDADTDRRRAYQEHIAGYMVKTAVGPQFAKLIHLLNSYHAAIRMPQEQVAP